jgi:pSer/pThr/pTyr-binding forkhead associated (FHA) protein
MIPSISVNRHVTIGRNPDCDVIIAEPSISRRHAELQHHPDGRWLLTDANSTHGTFVQKPDGSFQRITEARVSPGDHIRLGQVSLKVADLLVGVSAESPAPSKPPDNRPEFIRCGCGAVRKTREACHVCGQI